VLARWGQVNGYRDVLAIGLPLVASLGSNTVMQFTDRVFLGNYSLEAIAAALPAGIASFLFVSFFMGTASYVNVFIAQYTGSRAPDRVGASLWQGLYFSFLASLLLAGLYFLAGPLFGLSGHPDEIQRLEAIYFRILILGGGLPVIGSSLACFFSGRGLTRPVMVVNMIAAGVNIPLDYALINGFWIFPELGIAGAALATVVSAALAAALFIVLIFTPANNRRFAVWRGRAFDRELFGRLMKYGLPGGIQFFIDILAITFFIFMVGRLGKAQLAASNIAFSINNLAFLPMIGLHIAIGTMVGQAIGRGRPEEAVEATTSTLHIALSYMGLVALAFILVPEWLLDLFRSRDFSPAEFGPILEAGVVLLRFIAVYTLFDALGIVYSGAIKGAGDTRFVMWSLGLTALLILVLPTYISMEFLDAGLYAAWTFITLYISSLSLVLWLRYRQGKWKGMSVLEARPQRT